MAGARTQSRAAVPPAAWVVFSPAIPAWRGPAVLALLLAACAVARAQERPLLQAGARVRVTWSTLGVPRSLTGRLVLFDPDTVSVRPREAPTPLVFALRDLDRFEVNRGRPPSLMYGLPLFGALLGGWFGATVLGPDASCANGVSSDPECHWETSSVVVGAGAGVIVFGIAAQLLVPEVWQDVPLKTLEVGIGRAGRGAWSVALSARF
jgi:hypothetical protein